MTISAAITQPGSPLPSPNANGMTDEMIEALSESVKKISATSIPKATSLVTKPASSVSASASPRPGRSLRATRSSRSSSPSVRRLIWRPMSRDQAEALLRDRRPHLGRLGDPLDQHLRLVGGEDLLPDPVGGTRSRSPRSTSFSTSSPAAADSITSSSRPSSARRTIARSTAGLSIARTIASSAAASRAWSTPVAPAIRRPARNAAAEHARGDGVIAAAAAESGSSRPSRGESRSAPGGACDIYGSVGSAFSAASPTAARLDGTDLVERVLGRVPVRARGLVAAVGEVDQVDGRDPVLRGRGCGRRGSPPVTPLERCPAGGLCEGA